MFSKVKRWIHLWWSGVTDEYCLSVLGKYVHIWNGKSYFMGGDNDYLLDNNYIKIGFGRVTSGVGDWGGGFSRARTAPLKITVDKNLIIQEIETDSFYNSKRSRQVEDKAQKIADRLQVGKRLKIKNETLCHHITEILEALPVDKPISHDVFEHPHMLDRYTKK